MVELQSAPKRIAPKFELRMGKRYCLNSELFHHRMGFPLSPVLIELSLKKAIHCRVQSEWKTRRRRYPKAAVDVKAAGAFEKIFDF
jgi:hypothetical protein